MNNNDNQLQTQQPYFYDSSNRSFPIPEQIKNASKRYFFKALVVAFFSVFPIFSLICYFVAKRISADVKETIGYCTHMHCELPTLLKAAKILTSISIAVGLIFTFVWSISIAIFLFFFGLGALLIL